jgi:type II secretory pathway component GspD/PulD (secretin)
VHSRKLPLVLFLALVSRIDASDLRPADGKATDTATLASTLARRLNQAVILDAPAGEKVTIIGPRGSSNTDEDLMVRLLLESRGLGTEQIGNFRRIIKIKEPPTVSAFVPLQTSLPPRPANPVEDLDKVAMHAFKLKHVSVNEALPVVRFFTTAINILPYPAANIIFVVDNELNLRRLAEALALIDVPASTRAIPTVPSPASRQQNNLKHH